LTSLALAVPETRDIIGGLKIYSGSRDPDHAPVKGDLSFLCSDLT